jgi:hypothetical protein
MTATVEICVPAYGSQHPMWWTKVMTNLLNETRDFGVNIVFITCSSTMLQDNNKNTIIGTKRREDATDVNRNKLAEGFLSRGADYAFWIDDDTIPPRGAIATLLAQQREFVSGIYFLPKPPYPPIAYMRMDNGMYQTLAGYPKGALFQVDSVGMGCALIHRSVYEKIQDEHLVYMRPDASYYPIHKSRVKNEKVYEGKEKQPWILNGVMHTPVKFIEREGME